VKNNNFYNFFKLERNYMHFEIRNSYKNIGRGGFPQSQNIHLEQGKTVHDKDFIWNVGDSSFLILLQILAH
jgi:hypothetical protein